MIIHRYSEWREPEKNPFDIEDLISAAQDLMMEHGVSFNQALAHLLREGAFSKPLFQASGLEELFEEFQQRIKDLREELRKKFNTEGLQKEGHKRISMDTRKAKRDLNKAGIDPKDILDRAAQSGSLLPLYQMDFKVSRKEGPQDARESLEEMRNALERWHELLQFMDSEDFDGPQAATEEQAGKLKEQFEAMARLEEQLEDALESGDLGTVDMEDLNDVLGDEATQEIAEKLKGLAESLRESLENSPQVEEEDGIYKITPAAARKMGQKALEEIYSVLKSDGLGRHTANLTGEGSAETSKTRPWEYGDALTHLDLSTSLINAVIRNGVGFPVDMKSQDFEIYETHGAAKTAIVVLIDMSGSMIRQGRFHNAKKLSMALDTLIRTQFPEDRIHFVGFYSMVKRYGVGDLPGLAPKPVTLMSAGVNMIVDFDKVENPEDLDSIPQYFTNMQKGLQTARQILAQEESKNKTIFLISDGQPTAHYEGSKLHINYPPTQRTVDATLKEVGACTKDGITINTFMIGHDFDGGMFEELEFLEELTKINKGRLFYPPPGKLTQYVLLDYVRQKKKLQQL